MRYEGVTKLGSFLESLTWYDQYHARAVGGPLHDFLTLIVFLLVVSLTRFLIFILNWFLYRVGVFFRRVDWKTSFVCWLVP